MGAAAWASDLLDLLLPAGCVACGSWLAGGARAALICGRCRSRLRASPWPRCARCHHPRGSGRPETPTCSECREWPDALTRARHAVVLEHPADDLVHALKYEGWRELAGPMGETVAGLVTRAGPGHQATGGWADRPSDPPPVVVVPVPTTPKRARSRGYNQAELLAREVACRHGLPLLGALHRGDALHSQTSLRPSERRENVRGAFTPAADAGRLAGADVLLVDDVLTTGATASEAATALAALGARSVTLLTFARALADQPKKAR